MKMKRFHFVLALLALVNIVLSEIDRSDKGFGENRFLVVNTGRVETVLMWLRDIDLWACAETCVRHLRCVSFNYQHEMKWCEVADRKFQVGWVDEVSPGWKNYATPDKVNGIFGEWGEWGECSVVCGGVGKQTRRRYCNNPSPMLGGSECIGTKTEEKECNNGDCFNLALNKPSSQSSTIRLPSFANDGNLNTRSGTGKSSQPKNWWWQVDLQQWSTIQVITLNFATGYINNNRKYMPNLVVKTSVDEKSWFECSPIDEVAKEVVLYSCADKAQKARFVKIEATALALALLEVTVEGKLVD